VRYYFIQLIVMLLYFVRNVKKWYNKILKNCCRCRQVVDMVRLSLTQVWLFTFTSLECSLFDRYFFVCYQNLFLKLKSSLFFTKKFAVVWKVRRKLLAFSFGLRRVTPTHPITSTLGKVSPSLYRSKHSNLTVYVTTS